MPTSISQSMNLFLCSNTPSLSNAINLFLCNKEEALSEFIWLFVKGEGVNPGAKPLSASMNLFIQQNDTSTPLSGILNLYVGGKGVINSEIPLFVSGCPGSSNASIDLFISGKTTTEISSSINLAIPYVVGISQQSLNLYVNGYIPVGTVS